ncbi:MAG: sigma-70 family RNA polymerase sigma factor [Oscillospiraceae bacterium]|nr:sigma-70 family RNA polymerase sigma factor [Oscillospiraceae bacterium]
MDDREIIQLYRDRNEGAIRETSLKYGRLCSFIANNILKNHEDCEEVVNDTYLALWNSIPPKNPDRFSVFTGKIARNLALKKYEYNSASKRNPEAVCALEELEECVSGKDYPENEIENKRIEMAISEFLREQEEEKRNIFVLRYWYFESVRNISIRTGYSEGKIKSVLFRLRIKLRKYLKSEGIEI